MSELLGIARFTFHDRASAAEFRRLSERCLEVVRTQDTGTLQYDVYVDEGETGAVVVERYAGSEALVEHLEHVGDELMAAVVATGTVEGETLGTPGPELRARLQGSPVRLYLPFLSLTADAGTAEHS